MGFRQTLPLPTFSLYDITGKLVMSETSTNKEAQLNVAALQPSVYLVAILSEGKLSTEKLVKR